jgi:Cdc6-like AAA superfamily ATPase
MPHLTQPAVLDPDHLPDDIVDRNHEQRVLERMLNERGTDLHLAGAHGTGKTLLTRHVLDDASDAATCHLSCIEYDTQYKVLAHLVESLTGTDVRSGYHTAQLQDRIADLVTDRPLIVVLDDIDFLLAHDDSDLLYFLSRLNHATLHIVTVSATHTDLTTALDERTASSLNPVHLRVDPYTPHETYTILEQRARTAFTRETRFPKEALSIIAANTANTALGLCWLHDAVIAAAETITTDLVHETRPAAVQRYRDHLLASFSPHHQLLCDVIEDLTADQEYVHTGAIYEEYHDTCQSKGYDPLTTRRLSDYLKDLELLGIIQADYHYGGTEGKTRTIQLQQIK